MLIYGYCKKIFLRKVKKKSCCHIIQLSFKKNIFFQISRSFHYVNKTYHHNSADNFRSLLRQLFKFSSYKMKTKWVRVNNEWHFRDKFDPILNPTVGKFPTQLPLLYNIYHNLLHIRKNLPKFVEPNYFWSCRPAGF